MMSEHGKSIVAVRGEELQGSSAIGHSWHSCSVRTLPPEWVLVENRVGREVLAKWAPRLAPNTTLFKHRPVPEVKKKGS